MRRKLEEAARAAEEEAERQAQEALRNADLKRQRQFEKKAMQKERQRLRQLASVAAGVDGRLGGACDWGLRHV